MSFSLRFMQAGDLPAGLALVETAGWNQRERDWRLFLDRNPRGVLAAEHEGRVIGTAATLDYGPFAWISMVLVEPAARGRGVGTALLEGALAILKDSPCVRLDATPLGEPVYRKMGFVDEYAIERWERPAGAIEPRGKAQPLEDLRAIAALDAGAFGADRAWLLEWLREGAPALAWRAAGGFALGREGRRFTHIGPVMAADEETARALITAALHAARGRAAVIDIPAAKAGVAAALGFARQRPLLRMRLGRPAPLLDPCVCAIAGPELG